MSAFRLLMSVTLLTLFALEIPLSKAQASELFGKSIRLSYTYQLKKCVLLRCIKWRKKKRLNEIYISKDGKTIFGYTNKDAGEVFHVGQTRFINGNYASKTVRGNLHTTIVKYGPDSGPDILGGSIYTLVIKARGKKCSITKTLTYPGANFKYRIFGPVKCSVHEGNIFQ